jgi:lauroyl/myristoyl acyltransferase
MNLISVATSRWGPSLGMCLCRLFSRSQAYQISERLSAYISGQKDTPFVMALRGNMAVVHGLSEDHPDIDRAVAKVIGNAVRGYVDLFRVLRRGPEEVDATITFDRSLFRVVEEGLDNGQGFVLVGAHTCSFDLLLLALRNQIPSVQALTNVKPIGSSRIMNNLRVKYGLEVTLISTRALRQAVDRLRGGGVVAIAADMPVEGSEDLLFFGRKSYLPVGHARLALSTRSKIVVGFSHSIGEGIYRATGAISSPQKVTGDKQVDAIQWAQDSISIIEGFIRKWPDEWLMPIPVWPG